MWEYSLVNDAPTSAYHEAVVRKAENPITGPWWSKVLLSRRVASIQSLRWRWGFSPNVFLNFLKFEPLACVRNDARCEKNRIRIRISIHIQNDANTSIRIVSLMRHLDANDGRIVSVSVSVSHQMRVPYQYLSSPSYVLTILCELGLIPMEVE